VTGVDKVVPSAIVAVSDIASGSTLARGGFGLSGIPPVLIDAFLKQGATDLPPRPRFTWIRLAQPQQEDKT
jgi:acyl CoA:acetate/3-ketoacid CoA transferase alpha subunit